jgi:hypothetical protein
MVPEGSVGHVVCIKPENQWSIKKYEMRVNRYIEHSLHTLTPPLSSQIHELYSQYNLIKDEASSDTFYTIHIHCINACK